LEASAFAAMSKRRLSDYSRIVEGCIELTDEGVLTGDGGGIIARNGIFQVAGRFLLSGLAFECKVLFKWHRSFVRSFVRSLARGVSISPFPSLSFSLSSTGLRRCEVCPWDKRLHFLIFKCVQTSYPANPPTRSTEVLQRGFRADKPYRGRARR